MKVSVATQRWTGKAFGLVGGRRQGEVSSRQTEHQRDGADSRPLGRRRLSPATRCRLRVLLCAVGLGLRPKAREKVPGYSPVKGQRGEGFCSYLFFSTWAVCSGFSFQKV